MASSEMGTKEEGWTGLMKRKQSKRLNAMKKGKT